MDINHDAPAIAGLETTIKAPLDLVWAIQTDIDSWSRWNADVTQAELRGPLEPGTTFRWTAGGVPIVSTIQEVVPQQRIVWTGRTMTIRAVHVWTFEPMGHSVRVRTEESFEGFMARLFAGTMRGMLEESLAKGLASLKEESERRARNR